MKIQASGVLKVLTVLPFTYDCYDEKSRGRFTVLMLRIMTILLVRFMSDQRQQLFFISRFTVGIAICTDGINSISVTSAHFRNWLVVSYYASSFRCN